MAVLDKISGVEKAKIVGAGAQNMIVIELRSKSYKICVWGRIESGIKKAGALIFFL